MELFEWYESYAQSFFVNVVWTLENLFELYEIKCMKEVTCVYDAYTLIYIMKHPYEMVHVFIIKVWSIAMC